MIYIYRKKAASYTQYSLEVLKLLFAKEEQIGRNVYARGTKKPLSPRHAT
jgi:hypothetical protein